MNNIFNNKFLCVPFCVWLAIQIMKFITDWIVNKKPNFKRLVGAGGLPSSHSAVVATLTTLIGQEYGVESGIFAMSCVFSAIVMYDAAGVRRAAIRYSWRTSRQRRKKKCSRSWMWRYSESRCFAKTNRKFSQAEREHIKRKRTRCFGGAWVCGQCRRDGRKYQP